jgi:diguanylate cyclase (GGDEF)-like protein
LFAVHAAGIIETADEAILPVNALRVFLFDERPARWVRWLLTGAVASALTIDMALAQPVDAAAAIERAQKLAETAPMEAEQLLASLGDPAVLPTDRLRGRFFEARGLMHANLQRPEEALSDFRRSEEFSTVAGDRSTSARSKLGIASMTSMLEGTDVALPLFEAALREAREAGDRTVEALVHTVWARSDALRDRVDSALQNVRAAQSIAAAVPLDAGTRGNIAFSAAWVYRAAGDDATAAGFLQEALAAAREGGDRMAEADVIIATVDLEHERGNHAAALRLAGEARVAYEALRDATGVAVADLRASACLLALGRPDEALAKARTAEAQLGTSGNRMLASEALLAVARAEVDTKDYQAALRMLESAHKAMAADTPADTMAAYHRLLAYANAGIRNYSAAFMALEESDRWQRRATALKLSTLTAAQRALLDYERLARENEVLEQRTRAAAERLASSHERTVLLAGLLALLAAMAGLLVYGFARQRRLTRQIASLAATDHLTGISNRRAIDQTGEAMMTARRRSDLPLSVIELDIDEFKAINDRYGHAAGDAALQAVADVLRAQLRDADRIGRYGGEEFLVILPSLGATEAATVAERLRLAVQALVFDTDGRPMPLTVSAGVAGTHAADRSFDDVVRRADRALYEAKARGRNRVVVAPPPEVARAA